MNTCERERTAGKEGEMYVMGRVIIYALGRFFSLLLLNMYTFKEHNVIREKNNLKILSVNFLSIIF